MALHDRAEEYIQIDLPSINIYDDNVVKKQNLATQLAIEDKLEFRNNLAQAISITKVNYMLKVLKLIHGKGTIQDPEAYKIKIKHMILFLTKNLVIGMCFKYFFNKKSSKCMKNLLIRFQQQTSKCAFS